MNLNVLEEHDNLKDVSKYTKARAIIEVIFLIVLDYIFYKIIPNQMAIALNPTLTGVMLFLVFILLVVAGSYINFTYFQRKINLMKG